MAWYNSSWNYRKPITISNSGSALTDYQVLVTVDTATLVTANKIQPDCRDIRFTSSDGSTLLNYWIESGPNTSSTKTWVKVTSILASPSTTTIYLYYGNSGAASGSDISSTYDFYEGFESYADGTAVPGTWSYNYLWYNDVHNVSTETAYSGTKSYKLGTYNLTTTGDNPSNINLWSVQITPASVGNWIRTYSRGIDVAYGCTGMTIVFIRASSAISIGYRFYVHYATQSGLAAYYDPNSGVAQSAKSWGNDPTYEIDLDSVSAGAWYKAIDRDIKNDYTTRTGDAWSNVQKIVIYLVAGGAVSGAGGSAHAYYDDISIRKYTTTEPTTCIGGEEVSTVSWLTGWNRRKIITVTGSTSGAQTDYQMSLMAHKATGTDTSTDIYLGTNVNNDFSDLRFTSNDGSTLLNYWIESYASGSLATVWVKIPSIPANPCTTTIYTYYNNTGASTSSSGTNTFDFFDDFSNGLTKWTGDTSYGTISSGVLTYLGVGNTWRKIYSNAGSYGPTTALRFSGQFTGTDCQVGLEPSSCCNGRAIVFNTGFLTTNNQNTNQSTYGRYLTNTWYIFDIKQLSATSVKFYINGMLNTTHTTYVGSLTLPVQIGSSGLSGASVVDWIFVHKYVSPEPTFSATGTEELNITAYSMSLHPSETPCRTGICTIRADVTWQNLGSSSITFRPTIIIDGTTYVQAASDITIGTSPNTGSSSITTPTLSVGAHTICPYPN